MRGLELERLAQARFALGLPADAAQRDPEVGVDIAALRMQRQGLRVCLDPRFVAAWINLGRALHAQKRSAEALDACQRAVELAPHLADAWAGMGNGLVG